MPEKLDLQGLTTKEIAEQYEKTRQEALKQGRFEQATRTQSAADSKGNTTSTFFGNVADGPRKPIPSGWTTMISHLSIWAGIKLNSIRSRILLTAT
jgi:hypothetical protein